MSSTHNLIVPSNIPWAELKSVDLESLLYWLLVSMNARDVRWRRGGGGDGAADGGRDIEAIMYLTSPTGEPVKEKWWIEAKGRSKAVSASTVQGIVNGVQQNSDVDVLVIATNSVFSNPARDWLEKWQESNRRPRIWLWDQTKLEQYCCQYPIAIARLFSEALSASGKLQVSRAKLWEYATYTDEPALEQLWKERTELQIDSRALVALVSSECANGKPELRGWAMIASDDVLAGVFSGGLLDIYRLAVRAFEVGARTKPVFAGVANLVLASLVRFGRDYTSSLLRESRGASAKQLEKEKKLILTWVLDSLLSEITDVCRNDCERISGDMPSLTENERNTYWNRLQVRSPINRRRKEWIVIETLDAKCNAGFELNQVVRCPLNRCSELSKDADESLRVIESILRSRAPHTLRVDSGV